MAKVDPAPESALPEVSIIIPCYKAEATILDTIESVRAQTFDNWECILVSDDGRSYVEVLANAGLVDDPRIREHPVHTEHTGTVAPRNRALPLARGMFIADLDADDIWKPDRLAHLVPAARQHDVCFDVLECVDEAGTVLGWSAEPDGEIAMVAPSDVVAMDFPFHVIARRDLLGSRWLGHDSFIPDVVRTLWLASRRPVCWVRTPTLRYLVRSGSMSQSMSGSQSIDRDYTRVIEQLRDRTIAELAAVDVAAVTMGLERKRRLNREYMAYAEQTGDRAPFLKWILQTGRSGHVAPTLG